MSVTTYADSVEHSSCFSYVLCIFFSYIRHCLPGSKQHTHRCSDQGKASLNSVRPQEEVLNHELTFGCEE